MPIYFIYKKFIILLQFDAFSFDDEPTMHLKEGAGGAKCKISHVSIEI